MPKCYEMLLLYLSPLINLHSGQAKLNVSVKLQMHESMSMTFK